MILGCLALPNSAEDNLLGRITVALATMYVPHVKFRKSAQITTGRVKIDGP